MQIEDLQLALFLFPLDPALPGPATVTGSGGARWLASSLPEARAGAKVERIECELSHSKPFNRAVLRVRAALARPDAPATERTVCVKVFRNDRGGDNHRELVVARRGHDRTDPRPGDGGRRGTEGSLARVTPRLNLLPAARARRDADVATQWLQSRAPMAGRMR